MASFLEPWSSSARSPTFDEVRPHEVASLRPGPRSVSGSKRTHPLVYVAVLVVGAATAAALDARRDTRPADDDPGGSVDSVGIGAAHPAAPERRPAAGFCTNAKQYFGVQWYLVS